MIAGDGASIQLHIPPDVSLTAFAHGNFPGTYQAVGIWGIGRSYIYDLFITYTNGVQDRLLRGYFFVDPNVTQVFTPAPLPTMLGVPADV